MPAHGTVGSTPLIPDDSFPTATEFLEFCDRVSFGRGQLDMLYRDGKLVQFRIGFWHEIDEPCIQTAGSYGL